MCTSKRWIINQYNGKRYFVNCGRCEACLQEKAINRTNRIRNTQSNELETAFVTLTYDNDFVPYVMESQLHSYLNNWSENLILYRDADRKWSYDINTNSRCFNTIKRQTKELCKYDRSVVSSFDRFISAKNDKFKYLRYRLPNGKFVPLVGKIGVIHLPDVQKFVKRLRYYMQEQGYNGPLFYFYCSEYGENYARPHFHFVIDVKVGWYSTLCKAVHKAWPYDNFLRGTKPYEKMCQRAFNASSYVSSYVNGFSSLPHLFKVATPFKSTHHYSHGYGVNCKSFALPVLIDMANKADFTYTKDVLKHGFLTTVTLHVPSYVLHRWFPKFKGFSKLPSSTLRGFAGGFRPFTPMYKEFLGLTKEQIRRYEVRFNNARKAYYSYMLNHMPFKSIPEYNHLYSLIWSSYYSSRLRYLHSQVFKTDDYFEFYDNIHEYFEGNIENEHLDNCLAISRMQRFEVDPNYFDSNLRKHDTLIEYYYKYNKLHKCKDIVLSANDVRF